MAARKQIDWEAIEREYRTGQLSNVEIAKSFGITEGAIRKRAKQETWKKDLVEVVRKGVREKLVRDSVRKDSATDDEIAKAAIERGATVQSLHRKDSRQQQEIVQNLMGIVQGRLANSDLKPTIEEVRHIGGIMRDCSMALSKLVTIERQAYNLDEDGRRPDPVDEVTITFVEARVEG